LRTQISIVLAILLLSGCRSSTPTESEGQDPPDAVVEVPTEEVIPSDTPLPVPTETPEPTLVPTPIGQIFRDDFSNGMDSSWRWENENPDNWSISNDGFLEIIAEDDFGLDQEFPMKNMLFRDLPEGEIVITMHLEAEPDTNFQQAAIWLWENGDTHVSVNRGFCAPCGGGGFYFDYNIPGLAPTTYQLPGYDQTDVYLRIEISADQISLYYAVEENQWERLGRFGNLFAFTQVGIGISNIDPFGSDDDLLARIDYFEITALE